MILITGANGQVGTDLQTILKERKIDFAATDYEELDVTNIPKVRDFIKNKNIDVIINCAAYNNVDKAEEEQEKCYILNTYAPQYLALLAKKIGAIFVTYSTDFVFYGAKRQPYTEEDIPNPPSVYSQTKRDGEKLVLAIQGKNYVIRTSWVFGIGHDNFNKKVINWSKSKNELSIVDDQVSSPTYSYDLAYYTLELLKTNKYGLYHLTNNGECSKFQQAKYILDKIGWNGKLKKAKSSDFALAAKRSAYSKLSSDKLEKTIGQKLPSWQSGIDRFLSEIKK